MGSTTISWSNNKKPTISLSTTEVEYKETMIVACEAIFLRIMLEDLHEQQEKPTQLMCDNQSSIKMTKNPFFHKKTKHIDIQYHFVWDLVQQGVIKIEYRGAYGQVADIFTKALSKEKFYKYRDDLGIFPNEHYGGEMLES